MSNQVDSEHGSRGPDSQGIGCRRERVSAGAEERPTQLAGYLGYCLGNAAW